MNHLNASLKPPYEQSTLNALQVAAWYLEEPNAITIKRARQLINEAIKLEEERLTKENS